MKANDPRHGTVNGYTNLKCRCVRCRAAASEYATSWRHRTGRTKPNGGKRATLRHGTARGYAHYGCRCGSCRAANTEKQRRYRANKKALAHGAKA